MKKLLSLVFVSLLLVCAFTSCGEKPAPSSSPAPAVSAEPSKAENSDYLSWTFDDWDGADETEQKKCVEAYIAGIIEASGEGQDVTAEEIEAMQDYLASTLSIMFTSDKEVTLRQLIDQAVVDMQSVK